MASFISASFVMTQAALAVTAERGDLVIGRQLIVQFLPPLTPHALLDSSLSTKAEFLPTFSGRGAVSGTTRIYATGSGNQSFSVLDSTLQIIRIVNTPAPISSLAADSAGNVYVAATNGMLYTFDASGALVRQLALGGVSRIDIAPDACTLWYVDQNLHLQSYDLCLDQARPSVATTYLFTFVRGLNDGGFVGGFGSDLFVFNAAGDLVRTIRFGTFDVFDAAFSPDGEFLYLSVQLDNGASLNPMFSIQKRRVADASLITNTAPGNIVAVTVSVVGEQRPTAEALAAAAVPMLSPWLFAALAAAIAIIALRRAG